MNLLLILLFLSSASLQSAAAARADNPDQGIYTTLQATLLQALATDDAETVQDIIEQGATMNAPFGQTVCSYFSGKAFENSLEMRLGFSTPCIEALLSENNNALLGLLTSPELPDLDLCIINSNGGRASEIFDTRELFAQKLANELSTTDRRPNYRLVEVMLSIFKGDRCPLDDIFIISSEQKISLFTFLRDCTNPFIHGHLNERIVKQIAKLIELDKAKKFEKQPPKVRRKLPQRPIPETDV